MPKADTTTSCRAFALTAALVLSFASGSPAADRFPAPRLPVKTHWSVDLRAGVGGAPVSDGDRVYLALRTAHIVALALSDGHELWRIEKDVSAPMAASDGMLFVSAADAIEALRGTDGKSIWTAPRVKAAAPLVAAAGLLIAATESEVVTIKAADGQIVWRHAAGGVRQAPIVDGERVFVGADDGRLLAMKLSTGEVTWEKYVEGGVTALAAYRGLVYAGAGNKQFYCMDARNGAVRWPYRIGSIPSGAIAVDDDRVYFTALDNVVRALDRETGNQQWQTPLNRRPVAGVRLVGHVIFVQVSGTELRMLLDRTGAGSGNIPLPGETTRDTPPDVRETAAGVNVVVVTGGLSNQWQLTLIGPAAEPALEPLDRWTPLPGVSFLTDPLPAPIGRVLPWLVLTDPIVHPFSAMEWPIVLRDPPLEPVTTLPGLQLRPLSPVLPVRRGA